MEGDILELYFDAHNHLLDYNEEELERAIASAVENNVRFCSPNTTHQEQYQRMRQLAKKYPIQYTAFDQIDQKQPFQIIPSFGIHPCYLQHEINNPYWLENLQKAICQKDHYAIGEIGIDFRKDILETNNKERQFDFFIKQLQLSFKTNRTVTIHCVRAHGELLKIFKKYNQLFDPKPSKQAIPNDQAENLKQMYRKNPIVMHSYSGSKQITLSLLKLTNLNINFSLCLKRTEDLCTVIPIERLILETDAPYQNNPLLLKQQNIAFKEDETGNNNRMEYVRANVGSLCTFYSMDRVTFSKRMLENTMRVFQLIKLK